MADLMAHADLANTNSHIDMGRQLEDEWDEMWDEAWDDLDDWYDDLGDWDEWYDDWDLDWDGATTVTATAVTAMVIFATI